jgi:hypothetical protein
MPLLVMQRYDKTKLAAEAPPYVTVDGIARILVKMWQIL